MFSLMLLLLISRTKGLDYNSEEPPDLIKFDGDFCERKILFNGYGKSYHLTMYPLSRELFFSRAVRSDDLRYREIIACHLQHKTCRNIQGISGGKSVAYSIRTNELYFGGIDGIYKYDFITKEAIRIAEGDSIWHLCIFNNLFYFIVYPSKNLYVAQNGNFLKPKRVIWGTIDTFFVSKDSTVYFSNSTALYKVEKPALPQKKPIRLDKSIHVRQITQDIYNDVYFGAVEGIYVDDNNKVKKISSIMNVFGLTYVNVITASARSGTVVKVIMYSDEKHISRLICNYNSTNPTLSFGTF